MRVFVVEYGCITCCCVYVHRAGKCGNLLWGMGASHVGVCMCTEQGNAGICCGVWVHHMLVCVCALSGEMRRFAVGYGCITCWCAYVHRAGKSRHLLWGMGASQVGVCMCTKRGNPGICCGVWVHHMLVFVCAPSGEMRGFALGYGCITCWCLYVHRARKCGGLLWGMGASHAAVCICTERGNAGICCGVWVHHMLVCVCAPSRGMQGFVVGYGCITCWCVYVHQAGKCGDLLWGMGASHVGVCMCIQRGNVVICCGVWVHHLLVCVCAPSGEIQEFAVGYGCITCWCAYVHRAGKSRDLLWGMGASHVGVVCAPSGESQGFAVGYGSITYWCLYVHRAGKCGDWFFGMGASHVGVCMCTEPGNAGICCGVWVHHMLLCVYAPSGDTRGFDVGYGCITCWCVYVHRAGKCGDLLWGMGASHVGVCMCTERGNAGICCGVCAHHMLVFVCAPGPEMRGFVVGYGCIMSWCVYIHRAGKCGDLLWGMGASHVGECMCTERGNAGICCGVWVHHMVVCVCALSGEMR